MQEHFDNKMSIFRYQYNTDHLFAQLTIRDPLTTLPMGLITWFAVHPVSMNFSNQLISSDNKGAASMITEMYFNGDTAPIGQVCTGYFNVHLVNNYDSFTMFTIKL